MEIPSDNPTKIKLEVHGQGIKGSEGFLLYGNKSQLKRKALLAELLGLSKLGNRLGKTQMIQANINQILQQLQKDGQSLKAKPKIETDMKKPANKTSSPAAGKRLSLADLFDNTDASEASNTIAAGQHEVRLNSIVIKEDPKKGAGAFVEYESIDGEQEGRKVRQMYKLTDVAGNKSQGFAYLKRDLALLGYEDVIGKQLKKTLAEITEAQPMCIINVKENGQYTNAYLQGLSEGGELEEEGKPEEEEEEVEEITYEVGDEVKFTNDDGEEVEGTIKKITGDTASVKTEEGIVKVDLTELSPAGEAEEEEVEEEEEPAEEEEEEAVEIEKGSRVSFTNDDDEEIEGKVISIKGDKYIVKDDDGDKYTLEASDLTLVDEE